MAIEPAPIRTLLVDDEPLANAGLRALLSAHRDVEVVGEALSGQEAVRLTGQLTPDLLFLDIQMPRLDGFGVLREVMRNRETRLPAVIFVTAFDEFAVHAFEVQALDYLLKPVAEDRFRRALDRVRKSLAMESGRGRGDQLEQRLRALLDELSTRAALPGSTYRQKIMASLGPRAVVVEVAAIDWIGARDYCAELHLGGVSHLVRESLTTLEAGLDPSTFLRVHRSAIVNLSRVTELRRKAMRGLEVVLAGGARIPVSRNRRQQLIERLGPAK
jgi:two-component system LytT family response regulator